MTAIMIGGLADGREFGVAADLAPSDLITVLQFKRLDGESWYRLAARGKSMGRDVVYFECFMSKRYGP